MKKLIRTLSITLALICSFFFISTTNISAEEEKDVYQTYAEIIKISRNNNTISFTTKDNYNIIDITYEYTYYKNETLVGYLEQESTNFSKFLSNVYKFDVSDNVVGVKIWKIKYQIDNHYNEDLTTGKTSIGDVEATYREHVILQEGKLITNKLSRSCLYSIGINHTPCIANYVEIFENKLYFNFENLEVEQVTKATVDYQFYKHIEKPSFGVFTKSYNTERENRTYEADVDNNVIQDYSAAQSVLACAVFRNCTGKYEKIQIDKSDIEGYQWYVRLPDTKYDFVIYNNNTREVIDRAYIVKISYWDNESYYEDVKVVQGASDWVEWKNKDTTPKGLNILKKIMKWVIEHPIPALIITLLLGALVFIGVKFGIKLALTILGYILLGLLITVTFPISIPIIVLIKKSKNNKKQKEFDKLAENRETRLSNKRRKNK